MQNRSILWIFTILLTLACLYQLSFNWVASSVESDSKENARTKVDSVKALGGSLDTYTTDTLLQYFDNQYLQNISGEKVYPLLGFTYKKCKQHEINLGLDLQGGMNVKLEVSIVDLIKALSGYSDDPAFNKAIEKAVEQQKNSSDDFVTLFGKTFSETDPNAKLAAIFHNMDNKDKFPRDANNEQILDIIRKEAEDAVKRTEQVLRRRIDNLGVVQPKIQRLEGGRILVELPGVKDKQRVRKILQGTARLEFWETYENAEIYPVLDSINVLLKNEAILSEKSASSDVLDSLADSISISDTAAAGKDSAATDQSLADLLKKDSATAAKPDTGKGALSREDFVKKNPLFGILEPAFYQKNERFFPREGPVVGYSLLKDTAKVMSYLYRNDFLMLFPGKIKFQWDAKPLGDKEDVLQLFAIRITNRDLRAPLEGDLVTNARPDNDALGNPGVALSMNAEGAKRWKNLTKENVGKSIAIVLDNYVYSAPTVQGEISGGRSSITGKFTLDEAEDLSNVLKAGKLPAPSRIIEEAVVGPSLGKKNIQSGLWSFVIALLVVLLYIWFYYAKGGAVADIALIVNMFFIFGVLASLGATLTLPGIAGIVLTIGMSVDANVLIFERIREEMYQGKGLRLAIVDGYKNAYSAIIDGNLTTLLTAVILLVFGSGPIQGFATTLIIGICTSLFAAIFITRIIFEWALDNQKPLSFSIKITEKMFKGISINWIAKRKLFYIVSGAFILLGVISFFVRGFNYGVDFTGGRNYIVSFEQSADVTAVGDALEKVFVDEKGIANRPGVKIYGSANQVSITTKYLIEDTSVDAEEMAETKLKEGLTTLGQKFDIMSSQKVGPTVADDIKASAVWAIVFALIGIFLYIVIRFKKWHYGLGAITALFHDVMFVLASFSLFYGFLPFSLEVDSEFIAAILTVVGYSINDTVIVFDRIRENLGLHKRDPYKTVVNNALNQTLSRTINTSLTTIFVLLMIFIFGGEVIRGFVFAMLVGISVGTYSSLCIATPIVVDLKKEDAVV